MPPEEDTTLELHDYLRVLRRRKWIVIVTVIICVAAAFAMTSRAAPSYYAATRVLIGKSLVERIFVPDGQGGDSGTTDRQRNNEIEIMDSPAVREKVKEKIGREPERPDFTPLEDTDIVLIGVSSLKPKRAAETANAYAATYIDVQRDLRVKELTDAAAEVQNRINALGFQLAALDADLAARPPSPPINGRSTDQREGQYSTLLGRQNAYKDQYNTMQIGIDVTNRTNTNGTGARVVAAADIPGRPEDKSPLTNLLAGLAIGLVLGVALAFLREYLDDRIKTKDDLATASGETVIGLVPQLADWKNREATQLVSISQPRSAAAEAYRTVRTAVEFLSLDQPIGSLQVTSAMAGEGKTTTLANLAVTFARVGQRVIVLCCDLRRPRIHEFFGLSNRVGFTSMLLGDAPASEAIQAVRGDLPIGVVASGPLAPNPAELLASKRAVSVIEELDSQCDLLIIDSPPVLPVTDAQVISGLVDGVLLVASGGTSTKRDVRRAVELLHQVDAPLIGGILNGLDSKHESLYNYGDNRYYVDAPATPADGQKGRNGARSKRSKRATARSAR